jgi:hypothetical protein
MQVNFSEENVREAVKNSTSYSDALRYMGASLHGGMHSYIKDRIKKYELDTSHFTHRNSAAEKARTTLDEDILTLLPADSTRTPRRKLLGAMHRAGIPYVCSTPDCLLSEKWLGKLLNLEIEHIDGNALNNKLENLCFLCPNCHSQTVTNYRSRAYNPYSENPEVKIAIKALKEQVYNYCECGNQKRKKSKQCHDCANKNRPNRDKSNKITWPSLEEIENNLMHIPARTYALSLGVSDTGLRKHVIKARKALEPGSTLM